MSGVCMCISARRKETDFCDGGGWSNILGAMSPQALEKAKEASRKERTLVRQREQSDKADQINIDLYGSVSNTVRSIWFTFVNLIPSPVLIGSLSNRMHSGTHIGHSSSILQAVVVVISSRLCYMICFLTFLPLITVSQRVPKCVHIPECLALLLQTWINFFFFNKILSTGLYHQCLFSDSNHQFCNFQVLLNLANQYENNEMYPEALQNYKLIVKNRLLQNAGE